MLDVCAISVKNMGFDQYRRAIFKSGNILHGVFGNAHLFLPVAAIVTNNVCTTTITTTKFLPCYF